MKARNLQTSLSILKQMEDKLKDGLSKRNQLESHRKEHQHEHSNHRNVNYEETPHRDRLSSFCECQIKLQPTKTRCSVYKDQMAKQNIIDEVTLLKQENKELKKHILFLEKMNDHLKMQILNWTRRPSTQHMCNTGTNQEPVTIIKPKIILPDFQAALSQNAFLRQTNDLQQQYIEKLRQINVQTHQKQTFSDVNKYITPQRNKFKVRTHRQHDRRQTDYDAKSTNRMRTKPKQQRRTLSVINISSQQSENPRNRRNPKRYL